MRSPQLVLVAGALLTVTAASCGLRQQEPTPPVTAATRPTVDSTPTLSSPRPEPPVAAPAVSKPTPPVVPRCEALGDPRTA
ncbi:hypothetical protein AB0K14_20090 [Actinosynnema sp. NPDC050801]|uniref:hypothetical protein n=1 Tax=unclassified Actinosynnema TaxID=2637065 RepID=UPI0033CE9622